MRDSDVVVCTTPAREPYLQAQWLHTGLHVTCMGSDMPGKQELFAECLRRAPTASPAIGCAVRA